MDFKIDALGPCRKRVTVVVPPEGVQEEFDRQYDEINESVALPGFRKGRAPRKILEKRFATHLVQEVKEKLLQGALEKLLEEKKIEPLRPPEVDLAALALEPEKPFEFGFEVVTRPEFATPTWKGLEVKIPALLVTDADVDAGVEGLRRRAAALKPAPEAEIQDGDVVVVDWKARSGDSVDAHDENAWYALGRGVLGGFVVEGLDDGIRGKKAGATATLPVKVAADDAREELRNRELSLEVTVKEVRRYVLPEVDAAFLKRLDFDDVAELRQDLRKQIQRAQIRERERFAEDRLVATLVQGIEMSLPEEFVEKELEQVTHRRRTDLELEGVAAEEIDKRLEAERAQVRAYVEADLKRHFLLDRIADEEGVKVAEDELLQAVQAIARTYGRAEEEVASTFRDPARLAELTTLVRHRKVRETIRRQASQVEVAPEEAKDPAAPTPEAAPPADQ